MSDAQADRIIDGRELEPPEPFVRTMEALDAIAPGEKVMLQIGREPFPLYRALSLNGFEWLTRQAPDGCYEVLIWHKSAA
ncbi:DUF2249 domain-containing protein [Propionivibrio dicarboxylicus]|uniref:Uncharacterized conserved protein n=1 Tax=Propionivibrio dicarboxylicus TaxID=83767 RepID=A0A1G8DFZ4_9RHOO|nr:DUF2249 domain-containing protein [Propionivibrio dicarboxylicus]SDH56628.1 Uncharacterized conserved protein [Propionivibrio dicarboxylicus]